MFKCGSSARVFRLLVAVALMCLSLGMLAGCSDGEKQSVLGGSADLKIEHTDIPDSAVYAYYMVVDRDGEVVRDYGKFNLKKQSELLDVPLANNYLQVNYLADDAVTPQFLGLCVYDLKGISNHDEVTIKLDTPYLGSDLWNALQNAIQITPNYKSVRVGENVQFEATGNFTFTSTATGKDETYICNLTPFCTWESSSTAILGVPEDVKLDPGCFCALSYNEETGAADVVVTATWDFLSKISVYDYWETWSNAKATVVPADYVPNDSEDYVLVPVEGCVKDTNDVVWASDNISAQFELHHLTKKGNVGSRVDSSSYTWTILGENGEAVDAKVEDGVVTVSSTEATATLVMSNVLVYADEQGTELLATHKVGLGKSVLRVAELGSSEFQDITASAEKPAFEFVADTSRGYGFKSLEFLASIFDIDGNFVANYTGSTLSDWSRELDSSSTCLWERHITDGRVIIDFNYLTDGEEIVIKFQDTLSGSIIPTVN